MEGMFTMKRFTLLSDAILDGARLRPQDHGCPSMGDETKSCAVIAALEAVTGSIESARFTYFSRKIDSLFPVLEVVAESPCKCQTSRGYSNKVSGIIFHLNDDHKWTRKQIAAFVATVEERLGLCEIISDTPLVKSSIKEFEVV
jgi:hypothetical protein